VVLVEEDRIITVTKFTEQSDVPSWGLSRICHQTRPRHLSTYTYDNSAGNGVTVFVIDTGVNLDHVDFEGRASFGYNAVGDGSDEDGVGHGTHVSGTIAGKRFGIAKKAQIVAVKVLDSDGSGSNSQVIDGVQWVARHAKDKSVANMSLGGRYSAAVNWAVAAAIEEGITFGVAVCSSFALYCDCGLIEVGWE
jgi:oryzin